jgi:hypothetical protein
VDYPTFAQPSPTPTPTPSATVPYVPLAPDLPFALPKTRWDKVDRGPVPTGCAVHGKSTLSMTAGPSATAVATGPSMTCVGSKKYIVRAVVKLAQRRAGAWTYVARTGPSTPLVNQADAGSTAPFTCTSGLAVRAVSSFVVTSATGKQVRVKLYGTIKNCP